MTMTLRQLIHALRCADRRLMRAHQVLLVGTRLAVAAILSTEAGREFDGYVRKLTQERSALKSGKMSAEERRAHNARALGVLSNELTVFGAKVV